MSTTLGQRPPLLLSSTSYTHLHDAMCAIPSARVERGAVDRKSFPDGERYQRIVDDVSGRDVVILGGTISDEDTLEIFDLAGAAVQYGARTLTLVIPYFGYSTMERAVQPGEVVTAKARARLLSAIPCAADGSRVILVDLHSEGIPHYFEGDVRPVHLYAKPVVLAAIREVVGADAFVLCSTDAGRAKWVESLANELHVDAGFVLKRRIDGSHTEVIATSADVAGRHVVIYDDIIRTGGTLVGAASAYRAAGASRVSAVATHGVFPPGAVEKIRSAGVLDRIVVTDSHPLALAAQGDFVTTRSIAGLLVSALV